MLRSVEREAHRAVAAFAAKYEPMLGEQSVQEWLTTFSRPVIVTALRLTAWTRTPDGLDYRTLPRR